MHTLLPPPGRCTRVWAIMLGVPFLGLLTALTLTPSRIEQTLPNLLERILDVSHRLGWESLSFTRLEILANILVFIPVGILAFVLLPRRIWPFAVLIGPLLSLVIETTQLVALTHRAATATDVLANSAGALFGVALAVMCTLLLAPRPSPHRTSRLKTS